MSTARSAHPSSRVPARLASGAAFLLACALGASALGACARSRSGPVDDRTAPDASRPRTPVNTPSPATSAAWEPLFDGASLAGWHGFKTPGSAPAGWQVVDGTLVRMAQAGDLVTDRTFANFELALEWRVDASGNSGILYRIDPTASVTYESGPEMQVLDDAGHADGRSRLTAAGAAYGLYPAPEGVVKPAGQWNAVRLLVNGAHVEHWLNGQKIVQYTLWSPEWEAKVKASKFAAWPGYGRAQRGYIGLQDHGDRVAYRNIRIRELP